MSIWWPRLRGRPSHLQPFLADGGVGQAAFWKVMTSVLAAPLQGSTQWVSFCWEKVAPGLKSTKEGQYSAAQHCATDVPHADAAIVNSQAPCCRLDMGAFSR